MADRAEVTRVTSYSVTGKAAAVSVSRAVAYLILDPGEEEGGATPVRQGQVHAQIIRRS